MLARRSIALSIFWNGPSISMSSPTPKGFAMGMVCKLTLFLAVVISPFARTVRGQDAPSLGDLARQQRQQKEQSKAAPGKDAKASKTKVITNEEMPSHPGATSAEAGAGEGRTSAAPLDQVSASEAQQSAQQWKSQIQAQKSQVDSLQRQIDELNDSIRFAPANCVANCVQWNARQREKQQQAERMQAQLEEEKKRLDDMEESARRRGFGSSVYEP